MEKVTIRLAKSLIGRGKEQIAVAHSLGLNRPGEVTEQPDNAATQARSLRSPPGCCDQGITQGGAS